MQPNNNEASAIDAITRKTMAISRLKKARKNVIAAQNALDSVGADCKLIDVGLIASKQSLDQLIQLLDCDQSAPAKA